jgi:hypothetical protein
LAGIPADVARKKPAARPPGATKKNRTGHRPLRPARLYPMRLAQVGLGSGVGLTGFDRNTAHFWSGPRPILSLPEMPDNYRNL